MSRVFGFDESAQDMQQLSNNALKAVVVKNAIGEEMREKAESNFKSVTRTRTGDGAGGIIAEHTNEKSTIGWADRPGLHGYFFEKGFHALDNRGRRWVLKRSSRRTGRKRSYKKVKATYVPPRPHMRPAHDALVGKYFSEIDKALHN